MVHIVAPHTLRLHGITLGLAVVLAACSSPSAERAPAANQATVESAMPAAPQHEQLQSVAQQSGANPPAAAVAPGEGIQDAPELLLAVGLAIPPDTKRDVDRIARATIDASGDATVVFALRNENDDRTAIVEAAMADTLAALRAIYHSPLAARITSATVVGTYSVEGKRKRTRELPVLRAVLSAERARPLDWDNIPAYQLPYTVETWWMHAKLAGFVPSESRREMLVEAYANVQGDTEGRDHIPLTKQQVAEEINIMLLHLNNALFALSGNDVRIARSQFKQFFDVWGGAEEELRVLYPAEYDRLDLELERAEKALLHRMPEDVDTARFAMRAMRTGLIELVQQLEAQSKTSAGS